MIPSNLRPSRLLLFHGHTYTVVVPTGSVVVLVNTPGGPYPAKAVLTLSEQPRQFKVAVVVV